MPSQALKDFEQRLLDVEQLIDAHDALTRLRRAEASLQAGGQDLGNVARVIEHLVTDPGRGRRKEVHALNNAGMTLLSGHLQGFVVDIYKESAQALLRGHIESIDALTGAAHTRANPNPENIRRLFSTIGFDDIFEGLSWQKMSTESLIKKLQKFNALRNRIAHGANERVQKQVLSTHLAVFRQFSAKLDRKPRSEIRARTGNHPW